MSSQSATHSSARRLSISPQMIILAILLTGFFLRVYRLADRSVWWDEGYSGWLARQSLGAIANITAHDVHPPLFYWLMSGWRILSADGEFGLRLFSALVGLLTIAAVYRLGRASGGLWVALMAALLLAISRFHITWSQEIRMYALAALWATLTLWAVIQYWKRPSLVHGLCYALFAVAGLYTLYLFVMVPVIANLAALWWLWRDRRSLRALLAWAGMQLAVLLLYLPWIVYALPRIRTASTASPTRFLDFLSIYWTMLTMGLPLEVGRYWNYTVPVLVVALLGIIVLAQQTRRKALRQSIFLLLLLGVLLPAVIVFVVSLPRNAFFYAPQVAPRYLIILIAPFVVLLAWGLMALTRRWPRLLAVLPFLLVIIVGLSGLRSYHPGRVIHDDYQSMATAIEAYRQPQDAVVLFTDKDWPLFAFHYPGQWAGVPDSWHITPDTAESFLAGLWAEHDGIWLVDTPYGAQADQQGLFDGWLGARATGTSSYEFGDKQLTFYARSDDRAATIDRVVDDFSAHAVDIVSPAGPELYAYDVPVSEYESGDTIVLSLFWQGSGEETVTAGLMNEEGQEVKAKTALLKVDGERTRQQINLVVPPEAPSGRYALFVKFASEAAIPIGEIEVRQRQRTILRPEDVEIQHPTGYVFANGVRLLGFDLEQEEIEAGNSLSLTLYWLSDEQQEERYKVFTHVQGSVFNSEGNQLWGQQDNEPANGSRPLTLWHPGEVIVDRYRIPINEAAPPGEYSLNVGLYQPVSGERLLVSDGSQDETDHIALTSLTVVAPR